MRSEVPTTPLLVAVACTALLAFPRCASGGVPPAEPPTRAKDTPATHSGSELADRSPAPHCPMRLTGVEVESHPTTWGATLTFNAMNQAQALELRERGWSVAAVYDVENERGTDEPTPEGWPPPPAPTRVDVADVPEGIQLEIEALHSKDVADVQRHVRALARVMQESGDCPNVVPRA
jgi:hypothetical protein